MNSNESNNGDRDRNQKKGVDSLSSCNQGKQSVRASAQSPEEEKSIGGPLA